MKRLFNMYMDLPMSFIVFAAVVGWTLLCGSIVSSAIIYYVLAWCVVLGPFLGAVAYTEHKHEMKKQRVEFLRGIKEDLGEN